MPRTYICFDRQGEFTLTVPDDARLTFGPDIPFSGRSPWGDGPTTGGRAYALRVYRRNKSNLVAVFNGVAWFREEGIRVARRAPENQPVPRDLVSGAELRRRIRNAGGEDAAPF